MAAGDHGNKNSWHFPIARSLPLLTAATLGSLLAVSVLAQTLRVTASKASLRTEPLSDAAIAATVGPNEELELLDIRGSWYRVRVKATGAEGYIHSLLLERAAGSSGSVEPSRAPAAPAAAGSRQVPPAPAPVSSSTASPRPSVSPSEKPTVVGAAVAAFQDDKLRLAVKTLENPTSDANSTIGNALTDILFTELGRTGRFRLVERAAFEEVAKEVDFGSTDWVKSGSSAGRGGMLGAEFVVLGKVSNFSFNEQAVTENVLTRAGLVAQTMYRQTASVRVDFRVVSAATGEAVITESGSDSQSRTSAVAEMATYRRLLATGIFSAEAQDSLIGRATIGAIQNVVRKISDLSRELLHSRAGLKAASALERLGAESGKILAEAGDTFIVTIGSAAGLMRGDRLLVFSEQVTKNARGEIVYSEEVPIATLEVVDVSMADRSKAQVFPTTEAARRPREGDKVRVDLAQARVLRSGSAAPGLPGTAAAPAADVQRLLRQGRPVRRGQVLFPGNRYLSQGPRA